MMAGTQIKSIGARWILPVDQPPLQHASLTIEGRVIRSLNPGGQSGADTDLGDVTVIPKFVNAHTHLEFSDLAEPIGRPGLPITEWIPQVIAARQQDERSLEFAITDGIRQAQQSGTIAIGEIATRPWFRDLHFDDLLMTCFIERLGNLPDQCESRIEEARDWLAEDVEWCRTGISPHAPYSLHDDLFAQLIDWAIADRLPVAMHLAESREELQWLADGAGPFRDLLESLNVLDEPPRNRSPLYYLKALARTRSALIVHGNYLNAEELDFLAQHNHLHLVYCPRTHEFFGHDPWPLHAILERGINVATGTDSRASNPDLDVRGELSTIRRNHPDVDPATVLAMGTLHGARALGLQRQLGSLTPGKLAEYCVIPDSGRHDPYAFLL